MSEPRITVTKNGPYRVEGDVPLSRQTIVPDDEGGSWDWEEGETFEHPESYRLCRCGHSSNKPFCDNTHLRVGFDGTETASHVPYLEQAEVYRGRERALSDAPSLCATARFCDVGPTVWRLVRADDAEGLALFEREVSHCPSGRLRAWLSEALDEPVAEPDLEPSIGVVTDPAAGVAGPLWVRGGIPIVDAEGEPYEVRNRVTLCRCGVSQNKPFCDGSHIPAHFTE